MSRWFTRLQTVTHPILTGTSVENLVYLEQRAITNQTH